MTIVQGRQKRLDTKRKLSILEKEKAAEDAIKDVRAREKLVTDSRIGNLFKMS